MPNSIIHIGLNSDEQFGEDIRKFLPLMIKVHEKKYNKLHGLYNIGDNLVVNGSTFSLCTDDTLVVFFVEYLQTIDSLDSLQIFINEKLVTHYVMDELTLYTTVTNITEANFIQCLNAFLDKWGRFDD